MKFTFPQESPYFLAKWVLYTAYMEISFLFSDNPFPFRLQKKKKITKFKYTHTQILTNQEDKILVSKKKYNSHFFEIYLFLNFKGRYH